MCLCQCMRICVYGCADLHVHGGQKKASNPSKLKLQVLCESWIVIWVLTFKFQSLWSCNPLSHLSIPFMKSPSKAFQTSSFNCFSSLLIGLHNQGSYSWLLSNKLSPPHKWWPWNLFSDISWVSTMGGMIRTLAICSSLAVKNNPSSPSHICIHEFDYPKNKYIW